MLVLKSCLLAATGILELAQLLAQMLVRSLGLLARGLARGPSTGLRRGLAQLLGLAGPARAGGQHLHWPQRGRVVTEKLEHVRQRAELDVDGVVGGAGRPGRP